MDFIKKFIKNHSLLFIFIIFCGIMIGFGIWLTILFRVKDGNQYGNRLKDIEKYSISSSVSSKLEKEMSEIENVDSVSYRLSGKIINIIINVKPEMNNNTAKENSLKVLEYFDEDELSYYDLQVYINCKECEPAEDGTVLYPIIGYKKNTNNSLVWSNN